MPSLQILDRQKKQYSNRIVRAVTGQVEETVHYSIVRAVTGQVEEEVHYSKVEEIVHYSTVRAVMAYYNNNLDAVTTNYSSYDFSRLQENQRRDENCIHNGSDSDSSSAEVQ